MIELLFMLIVRFIHPGHYIDEQNVPSVTMLTGNNVCNVT